MKKPFTVTAVVFFSLIAVLQLLRFILGWVITVNGATVPVWESGVAFGAGVRLLYHDNLQRKYRN